MHKCVKRCEKEEGGAVPVGIPPGLGLHIPLDVGGWGRALGSHRGEMITVSGVLSCERGLFALR